ncbi:MAG: hypothetical protein ACOYM3_25650 [Terrimicrobiaceae bacterium]
MEQILAGGSQPEFFVKFGGRNRFAPFELRIGLSNGTIDVLDFSRREIPGQLLTKTCEENCSVLPRKLVCQLQDILHAHEKTMHHQFRIRKPLGKAGSTAPVGQGLSEALFLLGVVGGRRFQ